MRDIELYRAILGLTSPSTADSVELDVKHKRTWNMDLSGGGRIDRAAHGSRRNKAASGLPYTLPGRFFRRGMS